MKKIIMITLCLIIGLFVYQKDEEIVIPSDSIRVRIIANSNNINDLYQKKKLKDSIKNDLYNLIKNSNNYDEANNTIINNLEKIKKIIASKTNDFSLNYGKNYFPKKVYKGVLYPEGEYNSLIINLGKGLGDNWWCVLYPPLCMIEDNNTTSDVEYKSLIMELLEIDKNSQL